MLVALDWPASSHNAGQAVWVKTESSLAPEGARTPSNIMGALVLACICCTQKVVDTLLKHSGAGGGLGSSSGGGSRGSAHRCSQHARAAAGRQPQSLQHRLVGCHRGRRGGPWRFFLSPCALYSSVAFLHVLCCFQLDWPLLRRHVTCVWNCGICTAEKAASVARCYVRRSIPLGREAGSGPGCWWCRPCSGFWCPSEGSTHHHCKQVTPCLHARMNTDVSQALSSQGLASPVNIIPFSNTCTLHGA